MKVNILGVSYRIKFNTEEEDRKLETLEAYVDTSTKKIVVRTVEEDKLNNANLRKVYDRRIKHEVIHAILFESGLDTQCDWADNEEMIDFFALQFSKIENIFKSVFTQIKYPSYKGE